MKAERTSLFLMANLGAEAKRIFSAKENKDDKSANEALSRAIDIISKLKDLPDMKKRSREINLLAEAIKDAIEPNPKFKISSENIESYFLPFALRLMSQ